MQTFLPFPSFSDSARALDSKRLGKQRVECLQILKALTLPSYGWQHHPAVKMWRDYEQSLVDYGRAVCIEWIRRGYKDTCLEKIAEFSVARVVTPMPFWLTDDLCRSHQSNLLRKLPEHYAPLFPNVPDNLPYVWPA